MTGDFPDRLAPLRRWRLRRPSTRTVVPLALVALALGTWWAIADDSRDVKVSSVVVIVVVPCSLVLGVRATLVLITGVFLALLTVFAVHGVHSSQLSPSAFVMVVTTVVVALLLARRRDSLGLRAISAERVIREMSDRLAVQSGAPELPDGWKLFVEQRPADGAAICGDLVAHRLVELDGRRQLHSVLIDVSGSGISAAPRSLLLSGAVGGLLGTVEAEGFLPAANSYLLRQRWSLGFASAIYVVLDLDTGDYCIRVAGHPPAMVFRPAEPNRWHASAAEGTVLGVAPTQSSVSDCGVLGPGESLFLFTDGVVEGRGQDIDRGTELLQAAVEVLDAGGAEEDLARALVDRPAVTRGDDRTIVVIRRGTVSADLVENVPGRVTRL